MDDFFTNIGAVLGQLFFLPIEKFTVNTSKLTLNTAYGNAQLGAVDVINALFNLKKYIALDACAHYAHRIRQLKRGKTCFQNPSSAWRRIRVVR